MTTQLIQQKYEIISWITSSNDENKIQQIHRQLMNDPGGDTLYLTPQQREHIKRGMEDIKNGHLMTHEQVIQHINTSKQ
jgi:hypothetical protein